MLFSHEGLLVVLFIGLLVGWTVGNIDRGSGLGLAGDIIVGVVGAFIATLPPVHTHLGHGLLSLLTIATIGAMFLLLVVRLPLVWSWASGARIEPARGFESRWKTVELQEAKRLSDAVAIGATHERMGGKADVLGSSRARQWRINR